jgi:hypothetical protein
MIDSKLLTLEVEQIEAAFRGIPDHLLVLGRICYQKTKSADIVHDTGGIGRTGENIRCLRKLIRDDGCSYRMLPAAPQSFGSDCRPRVGGHQDRGGDLPGTVQADQGQGVPYVRDPADGRELRGVSAL